jgi:hypothetical protein
MQVAALRRTDTPSTESYRLCERSRNWKSRQGPTKACTATDRHIQTTNKNYILTDPRGWPVKKLPDVQVEILQGTSTNLLADSTHFWSNHLFYRHLQKVSFCFSPLLLSPRSYWGDKDIRKSSNCTSSQLTNRRDRWILFTISKFHARLSARWKRKKNNLCSPL